VTQLEKTLAVATVLSVLLAIAAIIQAYRYRNRRALSYAVQGAPLLTSHARTAGELEVRIDGVVVKDPHILHVQVKNTGNVPLVAADFSEPLKAKLPGAEFLSTNVVADPDGRTVSSLLADDEVWFTPELLQPGESVFVQAIIDGETEGATVTGRVAGVPELRPLSESPPFAELLGQALALALPSPVPFRIGPFHLR
jgi:hypothetical protein